MAIASNFEARDLIPLRTAAMVNSVDKAHRERLLSAQCGDSNARTAK
jgi:hypothetical protein